MAGCTHSSVKVYLNGKKLPVADFKSYVDLFLGPKQAADAVPRVFEKVGDRWEVAVAASEDGFAQVSFVNSIATSKGGTHVNHVADQVVDRVLEHLKEKHKGLEKAPNLPLRTTDSSAATDPAAAPTPAPVRPLLPAGAQAEPRQGAPSRLHQLPHREPRLRLADQGEHDAEAVRLRLKVPLTAAAPHPASPPPLTVGHPSPLPPLLTAASRAPHLATTLCRRRPPIRRGHCRPGAHPGRCQPSDKFFKDALNCGVLESILSFAQSKQSKDLKKTDGTKKSRLTGIPKLDDANEAGGRNGSKCADHSPLPAERVGGLAP